MTIEAPPTMFEDVLTIGQLPPRRAAAKLRQMGDPIAADALAQRARRSASERLFGLGAPKPWEFTTHQIGYLAPPPAGSVTPQALQYAGMIAPDPALKNARINIHLDRLRIYDYPGSGEHQIMFTFKAQNQLPHGPELVSFSQLYRAQEGQQAGINGSPIFIGLNVGGLGIALQGFTVN